MIVLSVILGAFVLILGTASFRHRAFLQSMGAVDDLSTDVWGRTVALLALVAKRERVKNVSLWIIPDFSPNLLVLQDAWGRLHLGLTEGALQVLDAKELEILLDLALMRARKPGYWLQSRVCLALFPIFAWLDEAPRLLYFLFCAGLQFLLWPFASYRAVFKADDLVGGKQNRHALASLMQKLSVAGRKTPLRCWNLAADPLFLFSPLRLEKYPFWFFLSQPSIESRRDRLLRSTSG